MARNVLLIQNDPEEAAAVCAALSISAERCFEVEWLQTCMEGLERLAVAGRHSHAGPNGVAAVLVDLRLPDGTGIEVFDRIHAAAPQIPIVVLISDEDEELGRLAVRRGAQDYLLQNRLDGYALPRVLAGLVDRAASSEALFEAREHARVTLNAIADAVICTDLDGCVTYLNTAAERLTGWTRADALAQPLELVFRLTDASTGERIRNRASTGVTTGSTTGSTLRRRDGSECAIESTAAPIYDRRGELSGSVLVCHELAAARPRSLLRETLSQSEGPAELPGRLLLEDRLSQGMALARRHGGKLAILDLDLDGFSRINDSLGHAIGDHLLRSLTQRLKQRVRATDTVCRQQGDEFVLLFCELATTQDAIVCARKMLQAVSEPYQIDHNEIHVTASTGIVIYPDDGTEAAVLLKRADAALNRAKHSGRNSYQLYAAAAHAEAVDGDTF
jgi:diguanylate cyclase (GGDEF)-like protein/PAS domain S-box-containing protein